MKPNVLILFFTIIPFWLFSNSVSRDVKYSRGMIFSQNNDTVEVYIKSEPLYNMQSGIHYLDAAGKEHSIIPSKAKGFCLLYKNDTMYFESRKDIKMVLFTSKKSKSSFIYRVSNGNIPLYYFLEKQLVMDGIDQVQVDFPRYLVLLDQQWFSITVKSFMSDFKRLIANLREELDEQLLDALLKEVVDEKYNFEDTPLIIEKLNKISVLFVHP